jgi:hypothetical protein
MEAAPEPVARKVYRHPITPVGLPGTIACPTPCRCSDGIGAGSKAVHFTAVLAPADAIGVNTKPITTSIISHNAILVTHA